MKKINKNVLLLMFSICLFIITFVIFKDVSAISYIELIGCEYCDSDTSCNEENENSFNNTLAQPSMGDIRIGSEDIVEDDREHNTSSLGLLSKLKVLKDKSKRRLYWSVWECHKDKYSSYKEFKESWDLEGSVRNEIKKDLKQAQKDIKDKIEKIRYQKRIIVYAYTGKRRRRQRNKS